ncbi:carbohydrate esterase [Mesonia sp. MT50]|uniref:Carbohydrate esterase n=1 Tax=Mesonia profundi TaxID=3070998 RepID=A0ABU0ZX05_9FLAO|nr:carbohydrate esterase [Mesonia profundi]MDQ7915976.1 carbohydrate esterase [Mesonia profundi]
MLLIYVKTLTPRINYTFKQVCANILGYEIGFTSKIEEFVAHEGMKLSYGKQKMGNEFFIQEAGLLNEQGFSDVDLKFYSWDKTTCFFKVSERSDIPYDIFSASFYLLSRYEEYLPHVKDDFGRYPFEESIGYKHDFLEQPVVDLWAYKFNTLLCERFSKDNSVKRKFQNKNVLAVSEAYKYRKKGLVRSIGASLRDFFKLDVSDLIERFKVLFFITKDPYDIYDGLVKESKQNHYKWHFLFQLSNYSINSKNVSYNKIKYHTLIKSMGDYGEIGLLPGYEALYSFATLKLEKKRWESIVNRPLSFVGSYNFDLNLPTLYNNFDKLEIEQDFSMSYAEAVGFRAGTCTSFLYYDINFERISPLVLEPVVFNSNCIKHHTFFELKTQLEKIKEDVEKVGGSLNILMNNKDFDDWNKERKYLNLITYLNEK